MADDAVLRALAGACPATRPAEAGDAVAGVPPRYAASPASVAEAGAVMRVAAEQDLTVVARGSGSRLDWGAPPRSCDLVVDTLRLDQVVEHAAGDLVARVQAGVGLGPLGEVLASAGQQLALDVTPGANGQDPAGTATVGGTLATGMAGPRRLRYGTPRDLVIGITVVRADGTVASSGGKVVKNVAGYDLGKLFAGSYDTRADRRGGVPAPPAAHGRRLHHGGRGQPGRRAPGRRRRGGQRARAHGGGDQPGRPRWPGAGGGLAGGGPGRGRRARRAPAQAARRRRRDLTGRARLVGPHRAATRPGRHRHG